MMESTRKSAEDERGMALVLALMVILVLTVIAAALMANVNTETKIAGYKIRDTQSLTVAEAGVQEAMLRIRNGDINDDGNPRNVHLIYNTVAGSIPVSGADTTSLPTLQPAGGYLPYSTATKNPTVLSLKYKRIGNTILRYDDSANPKINPTTGNPIWVITASGRNNGAYRSIYAEVTRSRVNVFARAAVAADVTISFSGNINVCGHDHRMDTPIGTSPGTCNASWHAPSPHTTCLPGAWATEAIGQGGSSTVLGDPTPTAQNQPTAFYSGPWDVLGMQQAEFWPWVGTRYGSEPASLAGIYYIDNDNVKQNKSGNFHFNGGSGEGFLYIDGDLRINGNFDFRGLIYCEGDLTINGNSWILGGIVVKGKTQVKIANGSAVVLYSSEAIQQKISKFGGNVQTIAWKEL